MEQNSHSGTEDLHGDRHADRIAAMLQAERKSRDGDRAATPSDTRPTQEAAPNAVIEAETRREHMIEDALGRRFGERGRALAAWYRANDLHKGMERPSTLAVMRERERSGTC